MQAASAGGAGLPVVAGGVMDSNPARLLSSCVTRGQWPTHSELGSLNWITVPILQRTKPWLGLSPASEAPSLPWFLPTALSYPWGCWEEELGQLSHRSSPSLAHNRPGPSRPCTAAFWAGAVALGGELQLRGGLPRAEGWAGGAALHESPAGLRGAWAQSLRVSSPLPRNASKFKTSQGANQDRAASCT